MESCEESAAEEGRSNKQGPSIEMLIGCWTNTNMASLLLQMHGWTVCFWFVARNWTALASESAFIHCGKAQTRRRMRLALSATRHLQTLALARAVWD